MPCCCSQLPEIIRLEDYPNIGKDSDELEGGNWVRLVRCRSCGQLWSLDECDKYQRQFAIKIARQDGWQQFDTTQLRKNFLVKSRGGLADEKCIMQGCNGQRVRGV